jgi:hypothetical protein
MRSGETIRQLRILKRIEASRYVTLPELAKEHDVTLRTIRRDIEALQEAGFPLYDDRSGHRKFWRLRKLPEHCAESVVPAARPTFTVEPYGRFFAVLERQPFSDAQTLVAVCVYRKGAEEVKRRLCHGL